MPQGAAERAGGEAGAVRRLPAHDNRSDRRTAASRTDAILDGLQALGVQSGGEAGKMDLEAGGDIGVLGHLICGNRSEKHVCDASVTFFGRRAGNTCQRRAGCGGGISRGRGCEEPIERLRHDFVAADRCTVERRHAVFMRPGESGLIRSPRRWKRTRDLGLGVGEFGQELQIGADAARRRQRAEALGAEAEYESGSGRRTKGGAATAPIAVGSAARGNFLGIPC